MRPLSLDRAVGADGLARVGLDMGGDECLVGKREGDGLLHTRCDAVRLDDRNVRGDLDVYVDDGYGAVASRAQMVVGFNALGRGYGAAYGLFLVGAERYLEQFEYGWSCRADAYDGDEYRHDHLGHRVEYAA